MNSDGTFLKRVTGGIALLMLSLVLALAGCDEVREEKVLDVEAPGVNIEVNKVEGEDGIERVEVEAGSTAE